MDRRNFLKLSAGGALLASTTSPSLAGAENRPPIPNALGMLYDSTLCVGCQACVTKCQDINHPERNPVGPQTWSNNDKLTPYTNNVIQVWSEGTGLHKDQEKDGYAYIKKQCMHCVDPNCVSVCPVSALTKDPKTGIVHYDPDICTGCRYCMVQGVGWGVQGRKKGAKLKYCKVWTKNTPKKLVHHTLVQGEGEKH